MRVVYVQFEWQGMGDCSCRRVFSPLQGPKVAKINKNIMISLMQMLS
jgi:hypothetical protein